MDVALLVLLRDVGHALEELVRLQEQVVEVYGGALAKQVFVALVGADDNLVPVAAGAVGQALDAEKLALGAGNAGEDGARREALGIEFELGEGALHQRHLVGVVIDYEIAVEADMLTLAPQHVRAECVEGGCGELIRRLPEQGDEALSHLSGSLVGEGDGGDAVGGDADDAHEVRDAVRDDARLAAAGARDDEQRAVDRGDGVALVVVQPVEYSVGGALWGAVVSS